VSMHNKHGSIGAMQFHNFNMTRVLCSSTKGSFTAKLEKFDVLESNDDL
jgi:hypothetical protein